MSTRQLGICVLLGAVAACSASASGTGTDDVGAAREPAPAIASEIVQETGCHNNLCNLTPITWKPGQTLPSQLVPVAWEGSPDGEYYAVFDMSVSNETLTEILDVPSGSASACAQVLAASPGGACSLNPPEVPPLGYDPSTAMPGAGSHVTCKPIVCTLESNGSTIPNDALWLAATSCVAAFTPSINVRSTGEADVVTHQPNGSLEYSSAFPGGSWTDTTIAGAGTTMSASSISVLPGGGADVVAMGPYGSLLFYASTTSGGPFSTSTIAREGTIVSAPSLFVRTDGEVDVVAQGPGGTLLFWANTGSGWSPTTVAATGTTFSAPRIFVRADGEEDIVAMGAGGSLLYYWGYGKSLGGPSTLTSTNQFIQSAPSIFVRTTGEADVVAAGIGGSLLYFWAMPGGTWTPETIAPAGTIVSAPAIYVRSTAEADVVAQGAGDSLLWYWTFPSWTTWSSATIAGPGTTFSPASVFVRPTAEADVVTEGANHAPKYDYTWPSQAWQTSGY